MPAFHALHALKRRLPFPLDAIDQVNALYRRWLNLRAQEDIRIVDLWTYCFIWRYLLIKFARDPALNEVDLDVQLGKIYEQVVGKRHTIQNLDGYASWVSVVCHNQHINYLRAHRPETVPFTHTFDTPLDPLEPDVDAVVLFRAIMAAIGRLPDYLGAVAELRVIHERTYEEIALQTGKNVVVVRSYANKALQRLRSDPDFLSFYRLNFDEYMKQEGISGEPSVSE
jgi:Sigma-70, region 4